ncbi:MAG TPA: hypothetical protein VMU50_04305 [Polyangia bacterium]|nr:hypothetical protein [Polyangia bacterium]
MHATMTTWLLVVAIETAMADGGGAAAPPAAARPVSPALLRAPQSPTAGSGEPSAEQYQLLRASDGSGELTYEASGFTARVARDGGVTFRDRHTSGLLFVPIKPGPPPAGVPTLEGLIRGRGKKPKDAGKPADRRDDDGRPPATTVSGYRPDPREACTYPRPCFWDAAAILVGLSAGVDANDLIMRIGHRDPYRYQKARFLAATQPMRVRMAGRAHAEDIQRSADELPRRLSEIACDDHLTVPERRGIITALGEEMDTSAETERSREEIRRALRRLDAGADGGAVPGCAADVRAAPTR